MRIDLLPESEASKNLEKKEIVTKSIYGLVATLLLIGAIATILSIDKGIKRAKFLSLEGKYKHYVSLKKDVQTLKEAIDYLEKEFVLVDSLFKKFYWSEKLLLLSELMPNEIWLKKLEIDKDGEIKMRGFLLPPQAEERPISVLSDFIKKLQENNIFFRDFSEISLIDVKSVLAKEKEIFEFNMNLKLKPQ